MAENHDMEETKEEPGSLSCNRCNYQTDESNLYVYRTNMAPLLSHIRRIHFGYQPYLCSHCPAVFPTLTDIDHHIEVCHDGNFKITSRRDADVERQADEDMCRILGGNSDMLNQNQHGNATAKHNGLFCSECNYGLEHSKDEDARIAMVKMDPLVCHIRRFHFGYLPFKCGHCPGVFPSLLDIERHVECAHKGEWKVSSNRNRDVESEVKRMVVSDHQIPGQIFIINTRSSVRFNDSDNANQGQNLTADQGLDMQPVVRLERCISAPATVHNFQETPVNGEWPRKLAGSSELTSPNRSLGSRPRVDKYKEFIQSLSRRGLPRMPARPRRLTSDRQAAIIARNVQTSSHRRNQFTTLIKPSPTALKACFDDDFEGVTMIQNRMAPIKCPKCEKICKPHGVGIHLLRMHKLTPSEHKDLFSDCKLCATSIYRQIALFHANYCERVRGSFLRKRRKAALSAKKQGFAREAAISQRFHVVTRRTRMGADLSIAMEARQQNKNGHISQSNSNSTRSVRSHSGNNSSIMDNGNEESSSERYTSSPYFTGSMRVEPIRGQTPNGSEDGDGPFWVFPNPI